MLERGKNKIINFMLKEPEGFKTFGSFSSKCYTQNWLPYKLKCRKWLAKQN